MRINININKSVYIYKQSYTGAFYFLFTSDWLLDKWEEEIINLVNYSMKYIPSIFKL